MSQLEKLIAEFCHDGVEYKTLGEIATISRGGNLQKKDFCEEGVPCIHYGQIYTRYGLFVNRASTFISEECAQKQKMAQPNDIVMAVTSENVEDICKCVAWLGETPVAVSGHTAIIHHNQNAKYLTYYFHTEMFAVQKRKIVHGTKVIEVTPDTLNSITLPLPPLEVQREIVRILENFTELTTELTTELAARKEQYAFYRNELLSFDVLGGEIECQRRILGEICDLQDGYPFSKEEMGTKGIPIVRTTNLQNGTIDVASAMRYAGEADLSRYLIKENDVVIGMSGTIKLARNKTQGQYLLNQRVGILKPNSAILNRDFLFYLLSNSIPTLYKMCGNGTVKNLSKVAFLGMKILVPPLNIQRRIVAVLDNFDAICSDGDIGLPAEIRARQKQYEYYRDKLLTFKEKIC